MTTMPDDPTARATREAVRRFNEAFDRHDADGVMLAMTEDCVFENTCPPPDGERYLGQEAVRGFWVRFFESSPDARFSTEEMFAAGDRCVGRWGAAWGGREGRPGHNRGVDIFRLRGGKVAEKLAYAKG